MEPQSPSSPQHLGPQTSETDPGKESTKDELAAKPLAAVSDEETPKEEFAAMCLEVVSDEFLRHRIRRLIDEKPKPWYIKFLNHQLFTSFFNFFLTGFIALGIASYYSNRQQELAGRRSFADELNKIRIQKIGEVWERIDQNDANIESLLNEQGSEDSNSNDKNLNETHRLIHEDRMILERMRFWMGEKYYDKVRAYLDSSIELAINRVALPRGADLSKLVEKRKQAKEDILDLRRAFLTGEPID